MTKTTHYRAPSTGGEGGREGGREGELHPRHYRPNFQPRGRASAAPRPRRDLDGALPNAIHSVISGLPAPPCAATRRDRAPRRQSEGHFFIAMELCGGGTLADLLAARRGAPLPAAAIARLAAGVAAGLSALHAARLLHLDLKPENLFLPGGAGAGAGAGGGVKIGDFGLCLPEEEWDEVRAPPARPAP